MTLEDRHQTVAELLPAYSLGALDGDELKSVEDHLAEGCERCDAELAEWNRLGERLADTVPPVQPAETTRARLLARVGDAPAAPQPPTRPAPVATEPARRTSAATWLALAASLAALVVASWSAVRHGGLSRELSIAEQERVRLIREQNDLRGSLAQARGELRELSSSMELVSSPATRRIALVGSGSGSGADATALVDTLRGTARFTTRGLAKLPSEQTYQLWYITAADGPVSVGVFAPDATGRAVVEVAAVPHERVQLWAVTIEPAGGVPQPTGEMVLKS